MAFPIGHALRDELGWTHYRILMREKDPIAREWYMNECMACGWSSRDLDRQASTDAYHRLLAAANPDRRRKLKEVPKTAIPTKPKFLVPADFIKNPMLLEFLAFVSPVFPATKVHKVLPVYAMLCEPLWLIQARS